MPVVPFRPWTEAEDAYLRLHYRRVLSTAIAAHLGRSVASVRQHALHLGLAKPLVRLDPARVARLHAQGLFDREIARRLGTHPKAVRRIRGQLGLVANYSVHPERRGDVSRPAWQRRLHVSGYRSIGHYVAARRRVGYLQEERGCYSKLEVRYARLLRESGPLSSGEIARRSGQRFANFRALGRMLAYGTLARTGDGRYRYVGGPVASPKE